MKFVEWFKSLFSSKKTYMLNDVKTSALKETEGANKNIKNEKLADDNSREKDEKKYRTAEQYLFSKDYEKAYNILLELANEKTSYEMNALFRLGQMYLWGYFVEIDYKKAYEYFTESRHPDSYYHLGLMYYFGNYVKKDYQKAYEHFINSEHYLDSKFMIGYMNCLGQYVQRDYRTAERYFNSLLGGRLEGKAKHMLEMIKYFEEGIPPSDGIYY